MGHMDTPGQEVWRQQTPGQKGRWARELVPKHQKARRL